MNHGTVLLIEDEENVLRLLQLMLLRLGYNVIVATSGYEGLTLFQVYQNDIKFVISDVNMEPINGWELLQMVRVFSLDVPFVLTSGYELDINSHTYKHQPDSYLLKPYLFKKLAKTIKNIEARKKI